MHIDRSAFDRIIQAGSYVVLVVGSAIGLVYYLRAIATIFAPLDEAGAAAVLPLTVAGGLTLRC